MSDEGRRLTKEQIDQLNEKARALVREREGEIPTVNIETGEVSYPAVIVADILPDPKADAPPAGAIDTSSSPSPKGSLAPRPAGSVTPEVIGRPNSTQVKGQLAKRNLEYIARLDNRVRRKHTRIVEQIALAADIDTGAPKPEGWTDREYRIAQDARNGPREAPMYLGAAQKIVESFIRAEVMADRDPSPQLNCDIQVFVQQNVYNYETLVVEDK